MADYMQVLSEYYVGVVEVRCEGDTTNYDNLTATSGVLPSEAELNAGWLNLYKTEKIIAFSQIVRGELLGGFACDIIESGVMHYYDSTEVDQLNLVGLVAASQDALYACRHAADSPFKVYHMHTSGQLLGLLQAGADWKTEKLQKFNDKKDAILMCSGTEGVDAISWDD